MDPELNDDEIEALQRAEDGEDENHDPKADVENDPAAAAAAPGPTPAPSPEPSPATTPAPTSAPAAVPTAGGEGKVEGVLSKDGARVLPYAALQAERRSARAASARAERTERELDAAKQQIADLKAGKNPDGETLTEQQVADMEANFPAEGKLYRAAFNRIKDLEAKAPKADSPKDEPTDDPIQEAIDQVPLLLDWQHGDPDKFARAVEHDALLMKSPKWADKPVLERFTEAARRTADEYDIAFEAPKKPSPPAAPAPAAAPTAAQSALRKPPETLSDFKGGDPAGHNSMNAERASPQALLNKFMELSDEEIDAQLAKLG